MGYVHDTQMARFLAPSDIQKTAGTWTPTIANNIASDVRSAAAAAFTLIIPIKLKSNGAKLKGSYLKSIDIWWKNATADLSNFAAPVLNKITLPASGSAVSGAEATTTLDAGHDTEAERVTQADHKMTITLSTPVWIGSGETYALTMVITAAATSVFTLYGAQVNFTLRV